MRFLLAGSAPQRTASAWDAFYADWVAPVVRFGTPALLVFVLLLIGIRVLSRLVVAADDLGLSRRWGIGYWLGVVGLAVAAVDACVTLPLSFDNAFDRSVQTMLWTTIAVLVVCAASLALLFAQPARSRDVAVFGGAAFAAFVLVGVAVYFPDQWHEPIAVIVWAVLLAKAAAVLAARIRGLQIGLLIEGRGKDGAADAGLGEYLRVRLHALGSQPPRGIALTQQTDVSALPDDALGLLPAGTLAKLGALLVQLFQRATPWRVIISEQTDLSVSVVMLRNGRVVETAVIRRSVLDLPDAVPPADGSNVALRTAAAAFVLVTLSDRHRDLRHGLGGATSWRSVACQVIATDPATTAPARVALLANAVAFDAGNLAAYGGLLALGYRPQLAPLEYEKRLEQLIARVKERSELLAVRLRIQFNLSVVQLNRAIDERAPDAGKPAGGPDPLGLAHNNTVELALLLLGARTSPDHADLAGLVDELDAATWLLRRSIAELDARYAPPDGPEPADGLPLLAYYERACLRMLQDRAGDALDDLFLAAQRSSARKSARTDASFESLHAEATSSPARAKRFKSIVGDPVPRELFALAPVALHSTQLTRSGIRTAEQLAAAKPAVLTDALKIGAGEAAVLIELAQLHQSIAAAESHPAAPLVFLLLEVDIASRAELRQHLLTAEKLRKALLDAARGYDVVAPSGASLAAWPKHLG